MQTQSTVAQTLACNICEAETPASRCERAWVRCNLRKFRDERFEMWRCPSCRSIHAAQEVDLPHYYAGYPILDIPDQWLLRLLYGNYLRRLRAAGLPKHAKILDYGCGSGTLIRYLRSRGYTQAVGYDAYHKDFTDRRPLEERYDCIISQDVIEHVDSPRSLLQEFDRLTTPDALIAIGTPDALAIDLQQHEAFVHALHAPFHRHILAHTALRERATELGWRVVKYYPTMYRNTLIPMENTRFGLHYMQSFDDCLDLLNDLPRPPLGFFLQPATIFYAFFGYFFDRHTDVMFTFRKGERAS